MFESPDTLASRCRSPLVCHSMLKADSGKLTSTTWRRGHTSHESAPRCSVRITSSCRFLPDSHFADRQNLLQPSASIQNTLTLLPAWQRAVTHTTGYLAGLNRSHIQAGGPGNTKDEGPPQSASLTATERQPGCRQRLKLKAGSPHAGRHAVPAMWRYIFELQRHRFHFNGKQWPDMRM